MRVFVNIDQYFLAMISRTLTLATIGAAPLDDAMPKVVVVGMETVVTRGAVVAPGAVNGKSWWWRGRSGDLHKNGLLQLCR